MNLAVGRRLGAYEILAPLGAGGMGEVYRARDTRLGREVAIKVLPPHLSVHPDWRARFEREARLASGLRHPNICVVHDVGREGDVDYLVMELVDGESLAERIRRAPLSPDELIRLGAQIAEALDRAHQAGIIHRDLKPANVMLSRTGAKLMDFGLAREPRVPGGSSAPGIGLTEAPTVTALTAEGAIVGTFHYMSPEQLEGREVDARSDVWALGCLLHEMATGHRPFEGATPASVISSILKDEPRPLRESTPMMPPALEHVVTACLAKDPEQRWRSAHDVALALGWAAEGPGVAADRSPDRLVPREFVLTAAHVRQLSGRNPRLVGHPMTFLDNRAQSADLVVYLPGTGGDADSFETVLQTSRQRAVAVTLVGFAPRERSRPVLGIEDHQRLLRLLLRELVDEIRPERTLLVGFSGGADVFLRMLHDKAGAGVEVAGVLALGPNVSLETCFATRLFAEIDSADPAATLAILKSMGSDVRSLESWLVLQSYIARTFLKLGVDLDGLRRYTSDLVAPFRTPGDHLAEWYRAARRVVPRVRLVFSNEESAAAEALLARHLEHNALGDDFSEESFVIEPVHHLALLDPERIRRHVEAVLAPAG